jgi:nitrogen regulatory protein P-II 1
MKNSNITYLTDVVMITCIVNHGRGDEAIEFAKEIGIKGAVVYHARGGGVRERLGLLGIAVETEKDVVTMVSPVDNRDLVISHLYTKLGLDRVGAGIIYATPLDKMATYIPDDILQTMQKKASE